MKTIEGPIKGTEVEISIATDSVERDGKYYEFDTVTINGLEYSGQFFQSLAHPEEGKVYRIEQRDDGATTIVDLSTEELALAIIDRLDELEDRLQDPDGTAPSRKLDPVEAAPLVNAVLIVLGNWPPKLEGWIDKDQMIRARHVKEEARRIRAR